MSFEPQTIALGGHSWRVPRLPWRVARIVQPALMAIYRDASGAGPGGFAALAAADFERLGEAVRLATTAALSGPKLSREEFDELQIGVADLMAAFPAVARCAGLTQAGEAESADPKAETATSEASTGTS